MGNKNSSNSNFNSTKSGNFQMRRLSTLTNFNLLQTYQNLSKNSKRENLESAKSMPKKMKSNSKMVVVAKDILNFSTKEVSETNVLRIIKKNNYQYDDSDLISKCLKHHYFFSFLDNNSLNEIMRELTLCSVDEGNILYKAGATGNYFYIVKSGVFDLFVNGNYIRSYAKGESFGEKSLLYGTERQETIKVKETAQVYCMDRRNFQKIVQHLNKHNTNHIKDFFDQMGFFNEQESEEKSSFLKNINMEFYDSGRNVVRNYEEFKCLYFVLKGEVACYEGNTKIKTYSFNDYFGVIELFNNSKNKLTYRASQKTVIFSITYDNLKILIGESLKDILVAYLAKVSLRRSKIASEMDFDVNKSPFGLFSWKYYLNGEKILRQGHQINSKIIIIIDGKVNQNKIVTSSGQLLFEEELLNPSDTFLESNLNASGDCLIAEVNINDFIKFYGGKDSLISLFKATKNFDILKKVQGLKSLSDETLQQVLCLTEEAKLPNNTKLTVQGEKNFNLFIIKSGKADVFFNSGFTRKSYTQYQMIGEESLFNNVETSTARAVGPITIIKINIFKFRALLDDRLFNYLYSNFQNSSITTDLNDLNFIKNIGEGNFGTVNLVVNKNKNYYAIKMIPKKLIIYNQIYEHIENEKNVMQNLSHPLLVTLYKTLKCDKFVYFLMEHIKGKELFDIIREIGLLDKNQTQFYGASICIALDYLHKKNFIYRDLKPENIMVHENGYIKLIDFGLSKKVTDKTNTIVGTPHYMAPEIINGQSYGFEIDFWAAAICIYEFVCGEVPFGEKLTDSMEIYKEIIKGDIKFPGFVKNKDFIIFMKNMLNPSKNFRKTTCLSEIKNEKWFEEFDWINLINFKLDPPYIPRIKEIENNNIENFVRYTKKAKEWTPKVAKEEVCINKEVNEKWFEKF